MAFRLQLRFRRRALARQSSALLACGLLATIPNAFLSCKAKNTVVSETTVVEPVETSSTYDPSKVNLDLTKMSATMIYSTIFNMLIMPEDYINKTIKVTGWFETATNPQTGEIYYAVVVPDATACCQEGLEFVWPGEHSYPADFPEVGANITITGLYKVIETDGITYTYLEASSVEF